MPNTFTHLGAQVLKQTGYSPEDDSDKTKYILVKLLSDNATNPTISTPNSVGVDLHSTSMQTIIIQPHGGTVSVPADIAMGPPKGAYI